MRCKHYYQYSQGSYRCLKCGKYGRKWHKRGRSRNQNKKLGMRIGLVLVVSLVGILFYNGVFELNQENLNKTIDTIKEEIPQIGQLETQIQEQSESIAKKNEEDRIQRELEQRLAGEKYIQDITKKVHDLTNNERTSRGLSALLWDSQLAQAALNHSTDMSTKGYFEHDSPEGHDFTWRYSQVGLTCAVSVSAYEYAGGGENIMYMEGYSGVGTIASGTVDGWMNSLGHRENILTPYFVSEGIGVHVSGNEIYVTQNFC